MRITFCKQRDRFEAISRYEEKDDLKAAGFWWSPDCRCWYTSDPMVARKMNGYLDQTAVEAIQTIEAVTESNIVSSRKSESSLSIPHPDGLDYYPFQKAGVEYLLAHPNALLADEMGLGKTIQVIGYLNMRPDIRTVLIICPSSLKLNWKRELGRWLTREYGVQIIEKRAERIDNFRGLFDKDALRVFIVPFNLVAALGESLDSEYDLVVVDEAHYIKNYKAQRTEAVRKIRARNKILLTGTPIVNRVEEIYNLYAYLDASCPSFWRFYSQYGRPSDLQQKLRSTVMIRRLKKDVLTELPLKVRQVIDVEPNGNGELIQDESDRLAAFRESIAGLTVAAELAKAEEEEEYRKAIDALGAGIRVAFTEISRIRHLMALAKVPVVVEYIRNVLENEQKVVVFAHHLDVIESIRQSFGETAVTMTGEMSAESRLQSIDRFQSDEKVRVFIGSITAAGLGITLTAARTVVFAELDWVPGNITQAEDRLHRIGQVDNVLVYHIVMKGSLDENIARQLVEKQKVIDAALDNPIEMSSTPLIPLVEELAATKHVSRATIHKEAEGLSLETIELIHREIRALAAVCDNAVSRDNMGFNRIDTEIGKKLAGLPNLTARQAALGKRILQKYHRQISAESLEAINKKPEGVT